MSEELLFTTTNLIGETTRDVGRPVFFDPHTQIINDKSPGTLVTGAPGSGKTFFMMMLAAKCAMMGKTTVVIDYKGDFLKLQKLQDQIGKVHVWDIGSNEARGSIDPLIVGTTPEDKKSLTFSLIEIFLGGLTADERKVLYPIISDVVDNTTYPANMTRLTQSLRQSQNSIARNIGQELRRLSTQPSAKACFSKDTQSRAQHVPIGTTGLTIVSLLGVRLPASENEAKEEDYGRVASGILFIITDYITKLLKNRQDSTPKCLMVDEAWSILATKPGRRIIENVSLLGRSFAFAYVLGTQNYSHLNGLKLDNTIATHFAFHAELEAAREATKHIGLDQTSDFHNYIVDLKRGECLMRDYHNPPRFAIVKIEEWRADWREAFLNNAFLEEELKRKKVTAE